MNEENKRKLIEKLQNIADRAAHVMGEEPQILSLDDGVAICIAIDMLSAEPEIIRCKDCRWRKDQSGSTAWLPCRAIVTPSDFYCGRAERRTDER